MVSTEDQKNQNQEDGKRASTIITVFTGFIITHKFKSPLFFFSYCIICIFKKYVWGENFSTSYLTLSKIKEEDKRSTARELKIIQRVNIVFIPKLSIR